LSSRNNGERMIDWLRKWAITTATLGTGAFVFVEWEWRSCHVSTRAARDAARRTSIAQPGAYCVVIRCGRILGRYRDGESLSHPGQVTRAQIMRLLAQDAQECSPSQLALAEEAARMCNAVIDDTDSWARQLADDLSRFTD
jgi:hypothetical protein